MLKILYFIGYLYNDDKVKPLHIILPKIKAYVKIYDGQTKLIYFLIKDNDSSEKYNTIWEQFRVDIKNFLKTKKQKSHGDEVTDFYDKKNSLGRF